MLPGLFVNFPAPKSLLNDLQLWILNMSNFHVVDSLDKRISLLDNTFREGQVTKFCTWAKLHEAAHKHKQMSTRLETEALTLRSLRNNDPMTDVNSRFSDWTKHSTCVQWQGHL